MYSEVFCKVYDAFGWNYYPEIFGQRLLEWMKQENIRPKTAMDLACGTGSMTHAMAARGYDMIGVDRSPEMLSTALSRTDFDREGPSPLFLCQDMRSFELYGTVGAVVCCLDSLNHLTEDGELEKCFALVHNYLNPDGLFLFDVNAPHKFRHTYGTNDFILENDGAVCCWQNQFDPAALKALDLIKSGLAFPPLPEIK